MKKLHADLLQRLQKKNETKVQLLVERSAHKEVKDSSNLFKIAPLNAQEESALKEILTANNAENKDISDDLLELKRLTSELKAINSQAVILHGERIKKAQALFKKYREGAFSTWLLQTYGNRQTPYNFLQYYEFYTSLSDTLREKMLSMPKQAVYTLASRQGNLETKLTFIEDYQGESKRGLLTKIRNAFPLAPKDKRKENFSDKVINTLSKLLEDLDKKSWTPSDFESKKIKDLISRLTKELR